MIARRATIHLFFPKKINKGANIHWPYSSLTNRGREVWALSQSTTISFQQ